VNYFLYGSGLFVILQLNLKTGSMNIKAFLTTLITSLGTLTVFSQSLENTTWIVRDNLLDMVGYYRFANDTISVSLQNVVYVKTYTYFVSANTITIRDISPLSCGTKTGRYNFLIQDDSLMFTLISDSCTPRRTLFAYYHWVRFPAGIQNEKPVSAVEIYPNPADDVISVKAAIQMQNSQFIIMDQTGRRVLSGKLTGELTSADISQFPQGLYFLKIGENVNQRFMVIRK
jgi:hypothetical protein